MKHSLAFTPGDVIQTTPKAGFWGCAVVLTAFPKTDKLLPCFHIGITPLILQRQIVPRDVDNTQLSIVRFTRRIRVAPFTYSPLPEETCIGIYTAKSPKGFPIIGKVDPVEVYPHPLTFSIGDGTNGEFPLCGPLRSGIGNEALVLWRQVHDKEAFEEECKTAAEQFEAMESERLARQRRASTERRPRQTP